MLTVVVQYVTYKVAHVPSENLAEIILIAKVALVIVTQTPVYHDGMECWMVVKQISIAEVQVAVHSQTLRLQSVWRDNFVERTMIVLPAFVQLRDDAKLWQSVNSLRTAQMGNLISQKLVQTVGARALQVDQRSYALMARQWASWITMIACQGTT
jgi:hypothetical protein